MRKEGNNSKESEELKMVTVTVRAEIRRAFVNEPVKIGARTKNGVQLAAMEFNKQYYNAEVGGEPCMLRVRDTLEIDRTLQKGQIVDVDFTTLSVESDTSQIHVVAIRVVDKK